MTSLLQTVDQERVALRTAAWLKDLRRRLNLSQAKAAKAAGVTRNTFASWEHGRTAPMLFHIERLKLLEKNEKRARGLR
jgi:DNA-binding XRE family transcriptional regulator